MLKDEKLHLIPKPLFWLLFRFIYEFVLYCTVFRLVFQSENGLESLQVYKDILK